MKLSSVYLDIPVSHIKCSSVYLDLPVSNMNRSSNHPDMWLRPPNKYRFVPTATRDAADRGGGNVPETAGADHFDESGNTTTY